MKTQLRFALVAASTVVALGGALHARGDFDTPGAFNKGALVDMKSGYLLGGTVQKGKKREFIEATKMTKTLGARAPYQIYSATKLLGRGVGDKPKSQDAPCEDTLFVSVSPNKGTQSEFAIAGGWNALPRVPRIEKGDQPIYRNAVARVLKSHGIKRPHVVITQQWRVDLEGDGQSEVLISATDKRGDANSISADTRAGQYSLVMMRKIVRGKVQTMLLHSEFYPQAKKFNAPTFFRIAAVLDVDGDGTMEIITRGKYYEGDWTMILNAHGEQVLSSGCGA